MEVLVSHSFLTCQHGEQAGLALFSGSVELAHAHIGPNMGREEEVLINK